MGYYGFHPNPFGLGVILGFGSLLYRWYKFKSLPDIWQIRHAWGRFLLVFLVFAISFLLPSFFSLDKSLSIDSAIGQIHRWRPCFFVLLLFNTRKEFFLSVFGAFALGEINLFYECWQEIGKGAQRFLGEYGSPNILAAVTDLFLPWCIGGTVYFAKNKAFALVGLFAGIVGFNVVLFSASRGAVLAILFTFVFLVITRYHKIYEHKKCLILVVLIGILIMGGLSRTITERYGKFTGHYVTAAVVADAEHGRLKVWKSAILMFKDHPLTGVGLNNFNKPYKTQYLQKGSTEPFLTHAHNLFLQNLAEIGLVGSIGFWGVLFFQLSYLFKKMEKFNTSIWLVCGFAVFLIGLLHNMVDYFFCIAFFERILWLQWGICYAHGEFLELKQKNEASEHYKKVYMHKNGVVNNNE